MRLLNRIFGVKSGSSGISGEELKNEFADLKKVLRRQTVAMEMYKDEIIEHVDAKLLKDVSIDMLRETADSFFYLENNIRDSFDISGSHRESFDIVWNKIEALLGSCGLEPIRAIGCAFDARLHEVVGATEGTAGLLEVKKVAQPGYLFRGKVLRPAKVVLGEVSRDAAEEQI